MTEASPPEKRTSQGEILEIEQLVDQRVLELHLPGDVRDFRSTSSIRPVATVL